MARISGVDIPREKRLEISLTYIFGIGRTHARSRSATAIGISPDTRVRDLTEEEVAQLRTFIDANLKVEGDLRREIAAQHQAQDRDRHLPGHPPPPRPPRARSAHAHQRRTRKGPKKTVAGKKKARK